MEDIQNSLAQGKLSDFLGIVPQHISTVISDVYIFGDTVLKLYKRDVEWWNKGMTDLSGGKSRIDFITQDFSFNRILSPDIYLDLKTLKHIEGGIMLTDPGADDDELVIVMNKVDTSQTLTKVLPEHTLSLGDYESIGRSMAEKKMLLPMNFLPKQVKGNWYEQLRDRFNDLEQWVNSESSFSKDVAQAGLKTLRATLEENKEKFSSMTLEKLSVCIDCNSENLLFTDHQLSFIDAFPPKAAWKIGAFDHDIFRTGSDIYALAGKNAYEAYVQGVYSVAENKLDKELHHFYLLYGAMIMGPYLYMLGKKNSMYISSANKYLEYIKEVLL
jgi:aminoglycoside phosphotransferase family enzyme